MINIKKLESRLKEFEEGSKQSEASKYIWKPKEGVQAVRIVPYKYNPEVPFIELKFYYKLNGKNYLAPCTFGSPDPILEFLETIRYTSDPASRDIVKKLEAKSRTYAPIVVRGEEEQGVKFWGFGVTVYKQLLKLMTNPKWGDITSITDGNDIEIEFKKESKKKGKNGESYPETTLTPDPRKTPVFPPEKTALIGKIKEQINIAECFPLPTYDELKDALDRYINPEKYSPLSQSNDDSDEVSASSTTIVGDSEDDADIAESMEKFFNK
jgi:hypothetical protein